MAHTLSANKRIRQSAKRRLRNRTRKAAVRTELKKINGLIAKSDVKGVEAELRKASQILDRVADSKTLHPNTVARRKSRLARQLNALKAAGKA